MSRLLLTLKTKNNKKECILTVKCISFKYIIILKLAVTIKRRRSQINNTINKNLKIRTMILTNT